jgi:hypothetical protein
VLTALLILVASGIVRAQTNRAHIGPHVAYNFDVEEFALGAQLGLPVAQRLEFYPSFDYYFVDPGSLWAVNADLKWRIAHDRPNWLYVGGGLNIKRREVGDVVHTDLGANLLVGVEPLRGRVHPFGEFRAILADESSVQVQIGLNITLGRH